MLWPNSPQSVILHPIVMASPMAGSRDARLCLLSGPLDDVIESGEICETGLLEMPDNRVDIICAGSDQRRWHRATLTPSGPWSVHSTMLPLSLSSHLLLVSMGFSNPGDTDVFPDTM